MAGSGDARPAGYTVELTKRLRYPVSRGLLPVARSLRTMRSGAIRASLVAVAVLVALGAAGCDDDDGGTDQAPALENPAATGDRLVNEFFALVAEKDQDGLREFLSDAFIVQRANGTSSNKKDYLPNLPDVGEYETSNVTAVQAGDSLVVAYDLTVVETIEGVPFETDPAPRLSTFIWDDGDWRLVSHANFNVPEAETSPS
jgi:hypothetical protein